MTRKERLKRLSPLFTIEIRFPKLDFADSSPVSRSKINNLQAPEKYCAYRKSDLRLEVPVHKASNRRSSFHHSVETEGHDLSTRRLTIEKAHVGSERGSWAQMSQGRNETTPVCLGCAPLVPVVKAAHLRDRSHWPDLGRVHGPRFRRVFLQREVRPGFVIIRQERLHMPVKRSFVEDDHVVQALAANRTNHALHVSSLPGRARRREYLLYARVLHVLGEVRSEIPSRSRSRYCGTCPKGNASRSCCAVHSAVG